MWKQRLVVSLFAVSTSMLASVAEPVAPRAVRPAVSSSALQSLAVKGEGFALLIGINDYPRVKHLNYAVKDAEAVSDVLIQYYGFKRGNITVLRNDEATETRIRKALSRFSDPDVVHSDDRILVFFAGHGQTVTLPSGGEMGFLLPWDAEVDLKKAQNPAPYQATCLAMDGIWTQLQSTPARHCLVIADACYSGLLARDIREKPIPPEGLAQLAARRSMQVITAGLKDQQTLEDPAYGHGVFTAKLLEELMARTAVPGQAFTASQLGNDLKASVTNATKGRQTPYVGDYKTEGEFLFLPVAQPLTAPAPKAALSVKPSRGPLAGSTLYTNSHAILVGVDRYPNLPPDAWSKSVSGEVKQLAELLSSRYLFPASNITVLLNEQATKANIDSALVSIADTDTVGAGDRVLLYLGGLAVSVSSETTGERRFWCPYDARFPSGTSTNLAPFLVTCMRLDRLSDYFADSPAKHGLMLFEATPPLLAQTRGARLAQAEVPEVRVARRTLQIIGARQSDAPPRPAPADPVFLTSLLQELREHSTEPGTAFSASELFTGLQRLMPAGALFEERSTGGEFYFVTAADAK